MRKLALCIAIAVCSLFVIVGYWGELINPPEFELLLAKLHIPLSYDSFLSICNIIGVAFLILLVAIAIIDKKHKH